MNIIAEQDDLAMKTRSQKVKIYYLIFISNLLINLDHGIIPAASLKIEESYNLSDEQLGLLGSLVYAGIVVMGILAGPMFLAYSPKLIIQFSMMIMMVTLALFTIQIQQEYVYYIIRFLTGAAQAPLLVYFPVWVDNNGGSEKTIWLTLLQGGVPFGVFSGYVMSSIISSYGHWQWSFYIQFIVMCPCLLGFILMNSSSFDIKYKPSDKIQQVDLESLDAINNSTLSYSKQSHCQLLSILFKSKVYMCVMLSICVLFFIITGIQFWISNYMETVLMQPQTLVNTVFSVVSVTAPTLGCLVGGVIVQLSGGYESIYALPICLGFTACSIMVSLPIPFINNFWIVSVLIWILLFCGGAQVPPLTGIMISSVSPTLRAFANANTTTFVNLLGFLPAPTVYGFISRYASKKIAITFLMWYVIPGFILQALAVYFQIDERKDVQRKKLLKNASSDQQDQHETAVNQQIQKQPFRSLSSFKDEGGTYLLLNDPEECHDKDNEMDISRQIFEYHSVSINADIGAIINQEIIAISQKIIFTPHLAQVSDHILHDQK